MSWSAGGKDDKNVYFADGAEYGHWGYDDELKEQYFHAGDVVYVDINEFENWRNSNAVLYVNFNEAAKKNSQDIILADADKSIWNPKTVDYEQEKNVFAYVITKEDEGRNVLRFWRGNDTTLWNCSVKLTYKDFSKGKNVVKIKDWNNQGVLEKRDFEINFEADKDNDSLCDYIETVLGLDKNSADTDNDGLTDGEEITITKTDAAVYDSYQSGVADGDVDMDGDGLTNKEEITYGSDPNLKDTDNDDIDDYTEVNEYKTKPADEDTDADKLPDGDEIVLGCNPLVADTDGNGIIDGEEYFEQTINADIYNEIINNDNLANIKELTVSAQGNANKNISVSECNNFLKGAERAYLGKAVTFDNVNVKSGKIAFELDNGYNVNDYVVSGNKTNGLLICYSDGENTTPLDTDYDETTRTLSSDITSAGTYFVLDVIKWLQSYSIDYSELAAIDNDDICKATDAASDNPEIAGVKINGQADIVFIVDTTGSMGSYIGNVKNNINTFVDSLAEAGITPNFALVEYRDITCDGNNSTKIRKNYDGTNWFNNVISFKREIGNLGVDGGGDRPETVIDGIEMARQLDMRESAQKFFIVITDADYKINNRYGITSEDELINTLKADGINLSVVSNSIYESVYKKFYENTDGIFADINGNFKDRLLAIASVIEKETNNGYWIALNGLIPRIVKLKEKPSNTGTADTDGDSLLDKDELILSPEVFSMGTFINKLGYASSMEYNIPVYNYNSDPTKTDTDDDGLFDGMPRYTKDDKVAAPKDSQPKVKNGNPLIWQTHVNNKNNNIMPQHYNSGDWSSLSGFDKKTADELVKLLLKFRNTINNNSKTLRTGALAIKYMCEGDTVLGAYILNFVRDDQNMAYHSQPDTWQRSFGYNDLYDDVFRIGSYMNMGKLEDNKRDYVLWMWKGDYWNLQSGTEIGLYRYNGDYSGTKQYDVIDFEVPMKLYLYYNEGGSYSNVFSWEPTDYQWWITGFNPDYREANPSKMTTIGKIDLSTHEYIYYGLKKSDYYNSIEESNVLFDDSSKSVWVIWN